MPTTRKKRKPARNPDATLRDEQAMHLQTGFCYFGFQLKDTYPKAQNGFPFHDEAHRKELWHKHRKKLLLEEPILGTPYNPRGARRRAGTRPAAWWDYDAPERPRQGATMWNDGEGIPERNPGNYDEDMDPGKRETEAEALARLGPLQDWEKEGANA